MKKSHKLILAITLLLAGVAVRQQLKMPPEERTWHGKVAGTIPYDFRRPTLKGILDAWWNPNDPRVFIERSFGIGWAINLYALGERFRRWMIEHTEPPREGTLE
ncbi:DUF5808 domain-containing protein [Chloroflexota bacterium]